MYLTPLREKMYKSRFTQWGLRKNAKRKVDGDQKQSREKRLIDRSSPLLAKHAGHLTATALAKTPRAIRSSAPLSDSVMTPPMLAIPERILSVIRDYFRGSFDAGTWAANGDERHHCRSTKPKKALAQLNNFQFQTQLACRLFDRKSFQDAGKSLVSATAGLQDIIFAEEPMTVFALFEFVLYTHYAGRNEIAFAILRHFSAMAMVVLGDRHPLCRISRWLSSMDPSRFEDVIDRCLSSVGDHFASFLGPTHRTTLIAHTESIRLYRRSEEKLWNLLRKCESDLGLLDYRTLFVHHQLSFRCYENHKNIEAKRLGQELVARSRKLQSPMDRNFHRAEGLHIKAKSEYALGQRQLAESHILEAIALVGPIEPGRAVCWLSVLEDWLLEQNREDSAAETRAKRWNLQELFDPPDEKYFGRSRIQPHDELGLET